MKTINNDRSVSDVMFVPSRGFFSPPELARFVFICLSFVQCDVSFVFCRRKGSCIYCTFVDFARYLYLHGFNPAGWISQVLWPAEIVWSRKNKKKRENGFISFTSS
jgi:hypothetical protein